MNNLQKQRLYYITFVTLMLSIATGLILYALKQNINVFLTPSQINRTQVSKDAYFRLGGLVKKNSVIRGKNLVVNFIVTDLKNEISVHYDGVLPDLFHEEKGVIAQGHVDAQGIFQATQILAKHDENYMPKKVYQSLRENSR